MTLGPATKATAALERLGAEIARLIASQGDLRTDLDDGELETLTTAFADPAVADAFLTSMPKDPGAKAILARFGDPAELAELVNGTLGGDMRALSVLAEHGCAGDPARIKAFADRFKGDDTFKTVFEKGGLAERPEALAALFDGAAGGDPDKLADILARFPDEEDAERLGKALGEGGLAQSPDALAALAAEDDGAMLKKLTDSFTTDDDMTRLNTMLQQGGLDGAPPGRPGLLRDVIKDGLGDDPARLKELHDAFHSDPGVSPEVSHMDEMERMLQALDGNDGGAGERLAAALDGFKHRANEAGSPIDDAEAARRLHDPFMKTLDSAGRAGASPEILADAADRSAAAAMDRATPLPEVVAGDLAARMKPGSDGALTPADLALALGPGAEALAGARALLEAGAGAVDGADAPDGEDAEYTQRTQEMAADLTQVTDTLSADPGGGALDRIKAQEAAATALLTRAASEPDDAARATALAAVKAAAGAVETALMRLAAGKLAASGAAGAAMAELGRVADLRSGAGAAEKAALARLGEAAMTAALAAAAAGTDADTASDAARAEIAGLEDGKQAGETDARNAAAEAAARAADAAADEIARVAAPVDPVLVERVAALAAAAAKAGQRAPDSDKVRAALAAAKRAAEAAAHAARRTAAACEVAAAYGNPDAAAALAAGSSCDQADAAMRAAGSPDKVNELIKDGEARRLIDDTTAKQSAREAVARQPGASADIVAATDAANNDAQDAGEKARDAAMVLDLMQETAPDYQDQITLTEDRARLALKLSELAVSDTIRKTCLNQSIAALKKVAEAKEKLTKLRSENSAAVSDAARAGALAIAEAEALASRDKDAADRAAKEAAARQAGPGGDMDAARKAADEAARQAGEDARDAGIVLGGLDPSDPNFTAQMETTRAAGQEALNLARAAPTEAVRKTAIDLGMDALKKLADAAERYAADRLARANAALAKTQSRASREASDARKVLIRERSTPGAGMAGAADGSDLAAAVFDARDALADRAKAMLSAAALGDTDLQAARDKAARAQAEAAVPGAGELARINAAIALRDADRKLAELADTAVFGTPDGMVAKLPSHPPNSDTSDTPLTTATDGMTPDVAFRRAIAGFEAANGAAAKWHESASAALALINRTLGEIATTHPDHGTIDGLKTPAETELAAAMDLQKSYKKSAGGLKDLIAAARNWAMWINKTGKEGRADGSDLLSSFGIASMQGNEGNRQDFVSAPRDALIRAAAQVSGKTYPGATGDKEDCDLTVPGGSGASSTTEDAQIRKKHICGRHVFEAYEFGSVDGGPRPDDVAAGLMIEAQFKGRPGGVPSGPSPGPTTRLEELVDQAAAKFQKVNSFLPEEVTTINVTEVAEKVMSTVRADFASLGDLQNAIADHTTYTPGTTRITKDSPNPNFLRLVVEVDIPPVTDIKIGIKWQDGKPTADMMHGTEITMTMADMGVIARANGM